MNKKANTLLFVLGATLFNIITTIACIFGLGLLIIPRIPAEGQGWSLIIIFIGAIALSFVIYRFILKFLMKKIDVDKYFDPIFGRKRK